MRDRWTNVLVEPDVTARPCGEGNGLLLAEIFEVFPYALLWSPGSGDPEGRLGVA